MAQDALRPDINARSHLLKDLKSPKEIPKRSSSVQSKKVLYRKQREDKEALLYDGINADGNLKNEEN